MDISVGIDSTRFDVPPEVLMGGYSARTGPSEGQHDPLHAKTVVIKEGNDTIVVTVCDLVGLERHHVATIKHDIAGRHGIPASNILIAATHTHAGPRNIAIFGDPFPGYEQFYETIASSITKAIRSVKPATIEFASGTVPDVSFNRRIYDPTSEHVDDECNVLVIKEKGAKKKVIAVIYNYACHPVVMGAENRVISADWVQYANESIILAFPGAIPVFLQGASGNLNPVNTPIVGPVPVHTFDDCKEIGSKIGDAVVMIAKSAADIDIDGLRGIEREVIITADDPDKGEMFTFADGKIEGDEFTVTSSIQALGFDDICIAGIPGELFSEISINIKARSPFQHVLVTGYANDYIGYIATAENYNAGGYETSMMMLHEAEGEIIENNVVDVINDLKNE
ncbi:MAG TPA: neutral/alkaline non-lysosomal ceramidase N-terminal domain-containing protein [Candidatus Lokiarchaeia archaeon]|nr:neutral/alkaline non-lysosomal ceramidase N-terminal domain-containing protein [Candidatus Lokiarchaeia archaeon]